MHPLGTQFYSVNFFRLSPSVRRIVLLDLFTVSEPPRGLSRLILLVQTPRTETFLSQARASPVTSVETSPHNFIQLLKEILEDFCPGKRNERSVL